MAWQLIRTYTLPRNSIELFYQVPDDFDITRWKFMVNNYIGNWKSDTVTIRAVGEIWRYMDNWTLKRTQTWNVVTQEDMDRRQLFRWKLDDYERYVEDHISLWDGDQIRTTSTQWYCNMMLVWELNHAWSLIEDLKDKVIDWSATQADKEKLALLSWWIYVIQTNNNTNNCSCW